MKGLLLISLLYMISRVILFSLIISFGLISCTTPKIIHQNISPPNRISISAINLSEDGSIFSSGEDEILLLLFNYSGGQPTELMHTHSYTFNKKNEYYKIVTEPLNVDSLLVVLIEMDTNNALEIIPEKIVSQHKELYSAYQNHDLMSIETILGDDDLLGIRAIGKDERSIEFKGAWRTDRYEYLVELIAQ